MARYAIIQGGVVANVIEADEAFAQSIGAIEAGDAAIGDLYEDGEFVPAPADLGELRQKLTADINRLRGEREAAGFAFQGVRFDSDDGSVRRITNAAVAAQAALAMGQPFSVDWTTEDNSVMPLDAAGVIALQATMAAVGAAIHYHARDLKAAVASATTLQALEAIDINAGWPGPDGA